ncbi:MAG: flagellar motor protein PomA [Legionellales bacterium]|nr:flagellar motor protein PomA [Legionellales bacterium]
MDLATLIGFIFAIGVVIMAIIVGGSAEAMFNVPSMLIVFGGTAGVVLMRFSLHQFFGAVKIGLKVLFYRSETPEQVISQVLQLAEIARKNGILALENADIKNNFLKQGVQHLVDGLEPEIVETMLVKDMEMTVSRHEQGLQIFRAIADVGPAMGMIGTLIGLVQMLSNLGDPGSLGPAMAIAMLTTLYGAILANIIATPIAEKLELRSREERTMQALIIDAVIGIQAGQNPRIINDILQTYLPGSKRSSDIHKAA